MTSSSNCENIPFVFFLFAKWNYYSGTKKKQGRNGNIPSRACSCFRGISLCLIFWRAAQRSGRDLLVFACSDSTHSIPCFPSATSNTPAERNSRRSTSTLAKILHPKHRSIYTSNLTCQRKMKTFASYTFDYVDDVFALSYQGYLSSRTIRYSLMRRTGWI